MISRRSALFFSAITGALILGGCEIRLGSGSRASLPKRSDDELIRDSLARRTTLISSMASIVASSSDTRIAEIARSLKGHTSTQLQALGGVWDPWPSGAPSGYPTVDPEPTAQSTTNVETLMSELVDGALQARAACMTAPNANTARLYGSLAVSWAWVANWFNPANILTAPRFSELPSASVLTRSVSPLMRSDAASPDGSVSANPSDLASAATSQDSAAPPSVETPSSISDEAGTDLRDIKAPTLPSPVALVNDSTNTLKGSLEHDYAALFAQYDRCRYILETLAAKSSDDVRLQALEGANVALRIVTKWSELSNVDERLAAYELPVADASWETWGQSSWLPIVEAEVGILGASDEICRANAVDSAIYAATRALDWKAVPTALPGYPTS